MRQVMQAGAAGFVTKSCVSDELLRAVRSVLHGNIYLPQELNGSIAIANPAGGGARVTLTLPRAESRVAEVRINRQAGR